MLQCVLNSKQLIHAYGPEKKVLIMPIIKTIKRIEKTAKLKVKKIANIKILIFFQNLAY